MTAKKVPGWLSAVLVGESLMKAPDIGGKVRELFRM